MGREQTTARKVTLLSNEVRKLRNRVLARYDLTSAQADALMYIVKNGAHGVTATDLMGYFSLTHQTASGVAKRLEEKGFVRREPDEYDGRKASIKPTRRAEDVGEALRANALETDEKMLRGMGAAERERLRAELDAAIANLAEQSANR